MGTGSTENYIKGKLDVRLKLYKLYLMKSCLEETAGDQTESARE